MMENKTTEEKCHKRGEIYYYDFGENAGSVQRGVRPVLILQSDGFNQNSPTVIVAAITSASKKRHLPSHVVLDGACGLKKPSMVLLEQLRTVNRTDLTDYVGCIEEEQIWKRINVGLMKTMGVWIKNNGRKGEIMILCPECLAKYSNLPGITIHRMDTFQKEKEYCSCCKEKLGFEYVLFDKRKAH